MVLVPKAESMTSKTLLLFLIILTNPFAFVKSQNWWCYSSGNYTRNSAYDNNLRTLLSSFPSNMDDTGFFSNSRGGRRPDGANALALCRSDIQLDSCRTCIQNATVELVRLCPYHRQAALWKDVCMLRYSNDTIIGAWEGTSMMVHQRSTVPSPEEFNNDLRTLLDDLRDQAASGSYRMKVAAGNHTTLDSQTIYALLQCTPDLFPEDCAQCLNKAAQALPGCCNNSRAVTIYFPSCYLQYQLESSYNLTRIQEVKAMMSGSVPKPVPTPTLLPPVPSSPGGSSFPQGYEKLIIGLSTGVAGIVVSSIVVFYIRKQRRLRKVNKDSNHIVNKFLLAHGSLAPKRYNYNEIKKITKSFTDKLGQGGYGIVYKGKLPDGQLVAVKVLTETDENGEEFINEVASISRTSHVNIVNLLGFCYEGKKRALVCEFMPNKSLDKFIYKSGSEDHLEWEKLYEIAVGVARGLEYLHRGCNARIVHFDIKPQNILLDQDFRPKISDFGLAKLFKEKQSIISMLGTRGTIGYIAPEVFSRNFGGVSHKSDVYSYGMMLLGMAGARKNVEIEAIQSSEDYFPDKIYEHVLLKNKKLDDLITEENEETARKMLLVGLWCIQTAPSKRPSMTKVVEMLEGSLQSIQIPPKPVLSSPRSSGQQFSSSFSVNVGAENSTES